MEVFADMAAPVIPPPFFGKTPVHPIHDVHIAPAVMTLVPQPEYHQHAGPGGLIRKLHAAVQVGEIIRLAPLLKAVDGHVDLMYAGIKQLLPPPGQQRTVGGDNAFKAQLACPADKLRQQGVCQRLPHEVVIEISGDPL